MKIKTLFILFLFVVCFNCKKSSAPEPDEFIVKDEPNIAKVIEENFDVSADSLIFSSGTIENFDKAGNSIDVYWMNKERDTILKFYRVYNDKKNLIGAKYFEEGDTEPSRDTVYVDDEGHKVEASLNADNNIRWKSTIHQDSSGNDVLMAYSNGKGEYRGYDSLYYDKDNRVIKGFYENSKGKRYSIKTYKYLETDSLNNWTKRQLFKNDTLNQIQLRTLTYHIN